MQTSIQRYIARSITFSLLLTLAFLTRQSDAQVVPYRVVGTGGINAVTGEFGGPSIGRHMGRMTYTGTSVTVPDANDPFLLHYTASDVQVAADGSELHLSGIGTVTLIPLGGNLFSAEWDGDWTIVGGTKRFANASGTVQLRAVNEPFDIVNDLVWYYSYEKTGEFDLGNR